MYHVNNRCVLCVWWQTELDQDLLDGRQRHALVPSIRVPSCIFPLCHHLTGRSFGNLYIRIAVCRLVFLLFCVHYSGRGRVSTHFLPTSGKIILISWYVKQSTISDKIYFSFSQKNSKFHFYKLSCIFAEIDTRRKHLDMGTLLY